MAEGERLPAASPEGEAQRAHGERMAYRYHDGKGEVWADPVLLHRKLVRALDGDLAAAFEAVQVKRTRLPAAPGATVDLTAPAPPMVELPHDMLRRLDGEERMAAAGRQAFGLAPFDPATGQGATDGKALELVYSFADWLEGNDSPASSSAT